MRVSLRSKFTTSSHELAWSRSFITTLITVLLASHFVRATSLSPQDLDVGSNIQNTDSNNLQNPIDAPIEGNHIPPTLTIPDEASLSVQGFFGGSKGEAKASPPPHNIQPTTSIIDILSSSAQFSTILGHLQRLGLVPLINQSRNITFLAPSNDAFFDVNPKSVTQDLILYHILNTTFLTTELLGSDSIEHVNGIYPSYLHTKDYDSVPYFIPRIDKKDNEDDEFVDVDYKSIPVFITKKDNPDRNSDEKKVLSIGNSPAAFPVIVEKDLKASKYRGVVQVVDRLMSIPKSTCTILKENPDTQIFYKIFSSEHDCSQPVFHGPSTIFVPSDKAFNSQLSDLELQYLLSEWGREDRIKLLKRQTMTSSFVSSPLIPDLSKDNNGESNSGSNTSAVLQSEDGSYWNISITMVVNSTFSPTFSNEIASDGIIHYYDTFLAGYNGDIHSLIAFTPEKHMLILGAETFVKEVKFRGLEHLINGSISDQEQTIFVPIEESDSAILSRRSFISSDPNVVESQRSEYGNADNTFDSLSHHVFAESTPTTLYHFIEGQHILNIQEIISRNYLLVSKAKFKRLGYGNQRIKVTADEESNKIYLNLHDEVTSGPYIVGNTTIYLIEGNLDAPPTADLAIGSVLGASRSANYLHDLGLFNLPATNGWTVLLPTTFAWKSLGLVTTYLESNSTALRYVLESHILKTPFYSDSDTVKTSLYDGVNVTVSTKPINDKALFDNSDLNTTTLIDGEVIALHEEDYYPFDLYIDDLHYRVETADVLSSAGVVHSINELNIPDTVVVTSENILSSVDATLFVDLLVARNLSHVLDSSNEYTILAPSNKVLRANNITVYTPHIDILLRMHILPGNPIETFLDGDDTESLQNDVHLTAKEVDSDIYIVSIVESDTHHEIRVLERGDTTKHPLSGKISTILYVDNFLSPDWIIRPSPPFTPPFHLKTPFAILLGVVFGAILIFVIISIALLLFLGRRRKHQHLANATAVPGVPPSPSISFAPGGAEIPPDKRPLLSRKSSAMSSHSAGGSRRHRSHRSGTHSLNGSPPNGGAEGGNYGALDDDCNANGTNPRSINHSRRGSIVSNRSVSSMTSEHSVSEPIPTGKVQSNREHGKHLNLPRVAGR